MRIDLQIVGLHNTPHGFLKCPGWRNMPTTASVPHQFKTSDEETRVSHQRIVFDDTTRIKLPTGSRKTLVLVLQAIRTCDPKQQISAPWLRKKHRVGQERQAMSMLRWLRFIDGKYLTSEVLENRSELSLLHRLLIRNLRRSCELVDIPSNVAERIGIEGKNSWDEIRAGLLK